MTQEEKQILLKDLCARIPYQPLCKKIDTEDDFCESDVPLGYSLRDFVGNKVNHQAIPPSNVFNDGGRGERV